MLSCLPPVLPGGVGVFRLSQLLHIPLRISLNWPTILAVMFLVWPVGVDAKDVVLLDTTTTKLKTLDWITFSSSGDSGDGWQEESFVRDKLRINWRTYVTCDVMIGNVQNWVRTPFIKRGDAHRVFIETRFTMRDCKYFTGSAKTCKETFSLYYREAPSDGTVPDWAPSSWTLLDRIAGDNGRFSSRGGGEGGADDATNVEVRSLQVGENGVYFAFMDEGSCTSLLAVKIYYKVCEGKTAGFASFPETPTGPEEIEFKKVHGHCVENAMPTTTSSSTAHYLCKSDGEWDHLTYPCQCEPGYAPLGQKCFPCPVDQFKWRAGDGACEPCPAHSSARDAEGSTVCQCHSGYFRAEADAPTDACTRPTSRPRHAKATSVDQSSAVLQWNAPDDLGGREDVTYTLQCQECPPTTLYTPGLTGFNSTTATLKGLRPGTLYSVKIIADNGVSDQVPLLRQYTVVEVKTEPLVPYVVRDIHFAAIGQQSLEVAWSPPFIPGEEAQDGLVTISLLPARVNSYDIKYFARGQTGAINVTSHLTTKPHIRLHSLQPGTDYGFQVRAKVQDVGWGSWSQISWTRTNGPPKGDTPVSKFLPIGLVLVLLLLVVAVGGLCCWCRKRTGSVCGSGKSSDRDFLDNYKSDHLSADIFTSPSFAAVHPSSSALPHRFASPLLGSSLSSSGLKPYVDPSTYEDPSHAVQEFASEIPADWVQIEEIIGAGEFGEVCRGRLQLPGRADELVAIKTLKPGSSEKERANFLIEASIMGQFQHDNVISLRGVVTKSEPVMIITEYMPHRSLDSFLRAHEGNLRMSDLVMLLKHIALGMKYLSEKGFVHRDLAARNILVDSHLNCKIADFGLSRVTEGSVEQVYTTKGGKIPIRWTAPEAITHRKFSSASDVWSFGVVVWEVLSWGERPYWDWTNQEVIESIDSGYRLPPPPGSPKALHDLMLQCWDRDRAMRPTFGILVNMLEDYARCPDLLATLAQSIIQPGFRTLPSSRSVSNNNNTNAFSSPSSAGFRTTGGYHSSTSSAAARDSGFGSAATPPAPEGHPSYSVYSPGNHYGSSGTVYAHHHPSSSSRNLATASCAHHCPNGSPPISLDCSTQDWLTSIQLDAHVALFNSAGLSTVRSCLRLNANDLTALGITHAAIQRTLLDSLDSVARNMVPSAVPVTSSGIVTNGTLPRRQHHPHRRNNHHQQHPVNGQSTMPNDQLLSFPQNVQSSPPGLSVVPPPTRLPSGAAQPASQATSQRNSSGSSGSNKKSSVSSGLGHSSDNLSSHSNGTSNVAFSKQSSMKKTMMVNHREANGNGNSGFFV